jgi:hypothetical protein
VSGVVCPPVQWEYPLQSLLQGMRALLVAAETYVRINDEGIMCIQHQVDDLYCHGCLIYMEHLHHSSLRVVG